MKEEWKGRERERGMERKRKDSMRKKRKEDEKAVIRQRVTSHCVCSQCNVVRNQMNEWMCDSTETRHRQSEPSFQREWRKVEKFPERERERNESTEIGNVVIEV